MKVITLTPLALLYMHKPWLISDQPYSLWSAKTLTIPFLNFKGIVQSSFTHSLDVDDSFRHVSCKFFYNNDILRHYYKKFSHKFIIMNSLLQLAESHLCDSSVTETSFLLMSFQIHMFFLLPRNIREYFAVISHFVWKFEYFSPDSNKMTFSLERARLQIED